MFISRFLIIVSAVLCVPELAIAQEVILNHAGDLMGDHVHGPGGFQAGISHPVLGLDHLLAMIAVGIASSQVANRGNAKAIWTVPTCFVLVMALGGALGMADMGLIAIEIGIALSVIVLGFTIASGGQMSTWLLYGCVSPFAIFHGYAHGQEIPELASNWAYIIGFMTGTAALHLIGVAIGHYAPKIQDGEPILRYSGTVIAGIGLHILWGLAGFGN